MRVPVVRVHLGQHPVGGAQIARPGGRQARAVRRRLDHHRPADLARLDPLHGCDELRREAAHEADLQDDARAPCPLDDRVAFRQVQRHRLFEEDVLAVRRGRQRELPVGEGRRGDDHRVERDLVQRLFEGGETGVDAELVAGRGQDVGHGIDQRHDLRAGHARERPRVVLADAPRADHADANWCLFHWFLHRNVDGQPASILTSDRRRHKIQLRYADLQSAARRQRRALHSSARHPSLRGSRSSVTFTDDSPLRSHDHGCNRYLRMQVIYRPSKYPCSVSCNAMYSAASLS